MESHKTYNWKRFWIRRTGTIHLGDNGYLSDPDGKYGDILNKDAKPFEHINEIPCLALLGEPGIGKTFALKSAFEEEKKKGNTVFYLDLRSFGDESRLDRKLFESPGFTAWKAGNHRLYLYLDSLDECLLQIKTIAAFLVDELEGLPLNRLYLRLACRTVEFPNILEDSLPKLWDKDSTGFFQLAPLRRIDITEAAQTCGIDAQKFLKEIEEKEAQPLAIKPVTLKFLLGIFKKNKKLPDNRADLYMQGCELLCEEENDNRLDAGFTGKLKGKQRLAVAARIAALTIFANRFAISLNRNSLEIQDEDLSLEDITGGEEEVKGQKFQLDDEAVREALSSGLFIGLGPNRFRWAHQTYAEFLAAQYLKNRGLALQKVMKLIGHPGEQGKLVPQLHETSAWLAGMMPELLPEVMKKNAEVLLRGDAETWSHKFKESLVDCLLKRFQEEKLPRYTWMRSGYYKKLFHPGLPQQLKEYIEKDNNFSVSARLNAVRMVQENNLEMLQELLADIVLDRSENMQVREIAAGAIAESTDIKAKSKLKALDLNKFPEDNGDGIKGYALKSLWPDVMSARELFDVISYPKRSNYFGSYNAFISEYLFPHLKLNDLPIALKWFDNNPGRMVDSYFSTLFKEVMQKSWEHFEVEGIRKLFSMLVLKWIEQDEYQYPFDKFSLEKLIKSNTDKRRLLLTHIFEELPGIYKNKRGYLDSGYYNIILPEDIPWVLDSLRKSSETDLHRVLAEVIWHKTPPEDDRIMDDILGAINENTIVKECLGHWFSPVKLNSEDAERMKRNHYERQKKQEDEGLKEPVLLEPSPEERIKKCLDKIESGKVKEWWDVVVNMTLKPDSKLYGNYRDTDLTSYPGWLNSDIKTRARILSAAQSYLISGEPKKAEWFNKEVTYGYAEAGYQALFLLKKENPKAFSELPVKVWKKWECVIITTWLSNSEEIRSIEETLLREAYQYAQNEFLADLLAIIDHEDSKWSNVHILDRIECCWDEQLALTLLEKLKKNSLKPKSERSILKRLFENESPIPGAKEFAYSRYKTLYDKRGNARKESGKIAAFLIGYAGDQYWPELWPRIYRSKHFAVSLLEEIAEDSKLLFNKNSLSEKHMEKFYLWIVKKYPHHMADPRNVTGTYAATPFVEILNLRDAILSYLEERGTKAACKALRNISNALPYLVWLKWYEVRAQEKMLQKTWFPPTPEHILQFTAGDQFRLVQNDKQLLDVIIESLERLENNLQSVESPASPDIWDKISSKNKTYRPKDENPFSDYVKRHLDRDLKGEGIVINREVQVNRGDFTDIRIDAVVKGQEENTFQKVSVIIEVKGCWHQELKKAMKTQLADRYLDENQCKYGLYLIGWFECDAWDNEDSRKEKTPAMTLKKAKDHFHQQAEEVSSQTNKTIRAFVMDTGFHKR